MDRSGNHYLVKWMDGDVEMKTWEFHHFVKDSSLVNEKGYLKRNEEDAAATGTKAEPPVQKEKSSEEREGKLAVGSPVWFWNSETRDYSKWGTIIKCHRGQFLIESKSGKLRTQTWENEGSVLPVNC